MLLYTNDTVERKGYADGMHVLFILIEHVLFFILIDFSDGMHVLFNC